MVYLDDASLLGHVLHAVSDAVSACGAGVGHRAAVFRFIAQRADFGQGEFPHGDPDGFQLFVGLGPMALSLLQGAYGARPAHRAGRDAAGEPVRDFLGVGVGAGGAVERCAAAVSEIRQISGAYPVRELFHDHDFSHPGALPGMDVGPADGHRAVRGAGVAGAAFWADAGEAAEVGGLASVN